MPEIDEFTLWMWSLDPLVLAATESFHCENHRVMVEQHEFNKQKTMLENRGETFNVRLARIGEWHEIRDRKQKRDTPKPQKRVSLSPVAVSIKPQRPEPTFTDAQMRIAQAVLDEKRKH